MSLSKVAVDVGEARKAIRNELTAERRARQYRLAAKQGHAEAQCSLGFMFANGRGVAQDDAEAARLFRLAAEQGYAAAQCS